MHTRPVRADELDVFVGAAGTPDHRREVEHYLESMFAAGSMRPEWCFVAEEQQGEHPLGRVAFWTLPGMMKPFALVLLDVPWEDDYMGVGTRLLGDVLESARALGAEEVEHVVDDPPMRPPVPAPSRAANRASEERWVRLSPRDRALRVARRGASRHFRTTVVSHPGGGR